MDEGFALKDEGEHVAGLAGLVQRQGLLIFGPAFMPFPVHISVLIRLPRHHAQG